MNPFFGEVSEKLHSKDSLLRIRKASKDQKEILACALWNGPCWSPVLKTLPCNFIETGLHR